MLFIYHISLFAFLSSPSRQSLYFGSYHVTRHYSQEQLYFDYLKLQFFCNIEREQKKREKINRDEFSVCMCMYMCVHVYARARVCIYVYIYLAHWVKVWNGYQRPMTLVNCNYYNKTLDQVILPCNLFFTSFYKL